MDKRLWSDLPTDLLGDIAGRLHVASDFVCFHAVCKPWRSSHDSTSATKKPTDQFLPWILSKNQANHESLQLRCVFSKSSYLAPAPPPPPIPGFWRNWVATANGTAVCYISSNSTEGPTLHDALTGKALTRLPLFPDGRLEEVNPCGIIYNDGTVLLNGAYYISDAAMAEVRAALLRPGDDKWTVIQRTLEYTKYREMCAAYHAGKILVTVQGSLWHVIPLTKTPATASYDVLVQRPSTTPAPHNGNVYEHSHVLESRGELLWALVHLNVDFPDKLRKHVDGLVGVGSVWVHALENENAPAPRWVMKEGNSLADRVLFLGWPNSFAMEATELGVAGGFVYFMYDVDDDSDSYETVTHERRGVFKYNLINNTTEFVGWMPKGWDGAMCTWLIPQPIIVSAATPRRNNLILKRPVTKKK